MQLNNGATPAARAVDDLYRSHAGEVYRYAYAMLGNRADAEDVTQATFVNALRALERGDRPRKPSNWLVTITHNIVRQRFRQQQSRPAEVELDFDIAKEEPQDEGPSVEDLVRALQCIPPTQREALVMRELEGRSYKEIEAILELNPAALETLLFRAAARSPRSSRTSLPANGPSSPCRSGSTAACRGRSGGGSTSTCAIAPPVHACTRVERSIAVPSEHWPCCRCRSRSRSSGMHRPHRRPAQPEGCRPSAQAA